MESIGLEKRFDPFGLLEMPLQELELRGVKEGFQFLFGNPRRLHQHHIPVVLAEIRRRPGFGQQQPEGLQLLEAIQEVVDVARAAGCRAEISHIKASGNASWGKSSAALELVERARREGIEVTQDQYLYTASSTALNQTIPDTLAEIAAMGVQIKDLDIGLLDFPCVVDDAIVLLCWKYGEEKIEFWHGMEEGFKGRKPIDLSQIDFDKLQKRFARGHQRISQRFACRRSM